MNSDDGLWFVLLIAFCVWLYAHAPRPPRPAVSEFWQYPEVMQSVRNQVTHEEIKHENTHRQ